MNIFTFVLYHNIVFFFVLIVRKININLFKAD